MNNTVVIGAAGLIDPQIADALSRERDTHAYAVDNHIRSENDAAYRALCADAIAYCDQARSRCSRRTFRLIVSVPIRTFVDSAQTLSHELLGDVLTNFTAKHSSLPLELRSSADRGRLFCPNVRPLETVPSDLQCQAMADDANYEAWYLALGIGFPRSILMQYSAAHPLMQEEQQPVFECIETFDNASKSRICN